MYSTIMIPVDLEHTEQMEKALSVGADLVRAYNAEVHLVSITQSSPTKIARTPEEFAEQLSIYADACTDKYGVPFTSHAKTSIGLTVDLDNILSHVAEAIHADLILMASHVPGLSEYIFSSHAGYLASHSKMSVFIVR